MKAGKFLFAAKEAVELVTPIFKKSFGQAVNVRNKNGEVGNLVSDVDLAIEKKLVGYLSKKFPGHQFIGEEFSPDDVSKNEFIWFIDPIDGTTNYVTGLPECGISVALWQGGEPLVAMIADPIRGRLYTAEKGKGAFVNGHRLGVSAVKEVGDALGAIGWRNKDQGLRLFQKLMPSSRKVRVFGSIALQLCYVAQGSLDYVAATSAKIWDVAAGVLIVEEAGGVASNWQDGRIDSSSLTVLVDNKLVHAELIAKLEE